MHNLTKLRTVPSEFIEANDVIGLRRFVDRNREVISSDFDLVWNTGWAFVRLREPREAVPYFRRAVQLQPSNAVGYVGLGTACAEAGRDMSVEAETSYRRAIELHDGWTPRFHLAVLLLDLGRAPEGVELLRSRIEEATPTPENLREYADYLEDAGDLDEAQRIREFTASKS